MQRKSPPWQRAVLRSRYVRSKAGCSATWQQAYSSTVNSGNCLQQTFGPATRQLLAVFYKGRRATTVLPLSLRVHYRLNPLGPQRPSGPVSLFRFCLVPGGSLTVCTKMHSGQ
jgi:hypothetical protein